MPDLGHPLSISQREVYLEHAMYPGTNVHSIGGAIVISGPLDSALFLQALQSIVAENDVFGIRIVEVPGDVRQQFIAPPIAVPLLDFSDRPREIAAWMQACFRAPIGIFDWPLFHFALLRENCERHHWFIKAHHVIIDGWGISKLAKAVAARYTSLLGGASTAADPGSAYTEVVMRDLHYAASPDHERDARYWRARMGEASQPLFHVRAGLSDPEGLSGDRMTTVFGASEYRQIAAFAAAHGSSTFRVLIAALYTLLSKLHGQADITFAYPVLNRNSAEERGKIGLFTRLLPLRMEVPPATTFLELLRHVYGGVAQNAVHKRFAISEIDSGRGLAGRLFDVVLSFEKHDYDLRFGPAVGRAESLGNAALPVPMSIFVEEFGGSGDVRAAFDYNHAYFSSADVGRFILHFREMLVRCIDAPETPLQDFELASPEEIERIRVNLNCTSAPRPPFTRIIEAFEDQARRRPNAPALAGGTEPLTYGELDAAAERLAHRILAAGNGNADGPIGIVLERGSQAVIAILAVLKAGGFFLAVDPDYPECRVRFMLEDSRAQVIITDRRCAMRATGVAGIARLLIDDEPSGLLPFVRPLEKPASPAYVIYTSGSTGIPKGVLVGQAGILNMAAAQARHFRPAPGDRVLQFASLSFDASIFEIFMALLSGAALVMAPRSVIDEPEAFGSFLEAQRVTIATLPPSYLRVVPAREYRALRVLITAGEAPRAEDVARFCARVEYYNAYGPTEASVWSTVNRIGPGFAMETVCSNIGRPIQNHTVWILDPRRKMLPVGSFGELCIGGVGLALGYLNAPALTEAQFIPHPYVEGETLYRSGDRARWLADGTIELAGRIDEQLKIRGFRIEPDEIEKRLLAHPGVGQAVVVAATSGEAERELAACLVLKRDGAPVPSAGDIRRHLQAALPGHMIPAIIRFEDALPLSPNGKIDRKALAARAAEVPPSRSLSEGRCTPLEQTLLEIWRAVLPSKSISLHDNFFDLGGHSLHAMEIASKLSRNLGARISGRVILLNPSVGALARVLENQAGQPGLPVGSAEREPMCEMSPPQKQIWLAHQLSTRKGLYNVTACYRVTGPLDTVRFKVAVGQAVLRHEALRSCFLNVNGALMFKVLGEHEAAFDVYEHDLAGAGEAAVAEYVAELDAREFDLAKGPLVRAALLKCAEDECILVLVLHHLVCDWLSIAVLQDEICWFYRSDKAGPCLPDAPSFREHAAWQNRNLESSPWLEHYWNGIFVDRPPPLRLPLDAGLPPGPKYAGALHHEVMPPGMAACIDEMARRWNTTVYSVLLASLNVLFHKYSGQTDVVLGTVMAGRESGLAENAVGCFMNTLAIRTRFRPSDTFAMLVKQVKQLILDAQEHQNYPMHRIENRLNALGGGSGAPLFNVMVDMMFIDPDERVALADGAVLTPVLYSYGKSKYDLTIYILAGSGGIIVIYEYRTALFEPATIRALAQRWGRLLARLLAAADREIRDVEPDDLPGLPAIRRRRI